MFGAPVQSGLTFTKVLSGIAKTLNVANQVIPLYREAKPMINNAKSIISVVREMGKSTNSKEKVVANNSNNNSIKKDTVNKRNRFNNPKFFL